MSSQYLMKSILELQDVEGQMKQDLKELNVQGGGEELPT